MVLGRYETGNQRSRDQNQMVSVTRKADIIILLPEGRGEILPHTDKLYQTQSLQSANTGVGSDIDIG